eukprot:TRINITY_DN2004_c0_g4_i4.p1 TRINITY_DN2004_c0_g4~~TRINITY_DN2004_c0_g4_i4.p1  ORF type:complete len:291 (+),score=47.67 TRINITY_DN2004_c0_g4_i4:85-957(+)
MEMLGFNKKRTLRIAKKHDPGSRRYQLHKQAKATLGNGVTKEAIKKPPDENLEDWLAMHTIEFYNELNVLYGNICDKCTTTTCPHMSAGPKYQYLWMDGAKYKKPTDLSAPEYVDHLMDWIEQQLEDPSIFPPTTDQPFPRDFLKIISNIFKRMFRFVRIFRSYSSILSSRLPTLSTSPHRPLSPFLSPTNQLSHSLSPALSPPHPPSILSSHFPTLHFLPEPSLSLSLSLSPFLSPPTPSPSPHSPLSHLHRPVYCPLASQHSSLSPYGILSPALSFHPSLFTRVMCNV